VSLSIRTGAKIDRVLIDGPSLIAALSKRYVMPDGCVRTAHRNGLDRVLIGEGLQA
jgi:hypothetical protein